MRQLLLPFAIAAALVAAPAHASSTRDCGLTSRIDGVRYQVKETKGAVACPTVKRIVTAFLSDGTVKSGWTCFLGHGSQTFDASCARGKSVVVRAYAPN